ncbi:hypothetical protein BDN72DRAFT_897286 [Pluteus cervinus]|uniref:Uncharacterized protein n=1 Tax=Pluteus cervinus TaxID=181527 RepID=A0ACD3AUE8_9AGAR|nr:hypothetical protein BDN72DRAFT_897286 [Pluteus cervinus]
MPSIPHRVQPTRTSDIEEVRWQGEDGSAILCYNKFRYKMDGKPYLGRLAGRVTRLQTTDNHIKLVIEESQNPERNRTLSQSIGILHRMMHPILRFNASPTYNFYRRRSHTPDGAPSECQVVFHWPKVTGGTLPIRNRDGNEGSVDNLVGLDVNIVFALILKHIGSGKTWAVARVVQIVLI